MTTKRFGTLVVFTTCELAVFGLAAAWLLVTARLSAESEGVEAVVIYFVGMAPMIAAFMLSSAIAIARATTGQKTAIISGWGVVSGLLGVLCIFLLSQASVIRADRGPLGIVIGIVVSGLSGFVVGSICRTLIFPRATNGAGSV